MADYLVIKGKDRATIEIEQETKVVFPFTFNVVAVKATSGSVTVSLSAGAQSGDDGSDTIAEGDSTVFSQLTAKEIYISGSGTVKVWAGVRPEFCPFKSGAKGGGSGGGCNYKGTTTTAIENGSTTNPITIDGESYTAVFGDIVVYGYTEFVFDGTQWSEFGRPFDTTPTSGSANAVTSNGIYWSILGKAGGGSGHAVKFGNWDNSYASGYSAFTAGNGCSASGNYSAALNNNTRSNQHSMTAIGSYNSPRTGDLFNIGNGNSSARSNIVEVNSTELNVNGDIQRDGVGIDDYTTTERKIGKWIDGSDLYQRTFEVTGLINGQWNNNILGTSGINIVDVQGWMDWTYNSEPNCRTSLNYYSNPTDYIGLQNTYNDLSVKPDRTGDIGMLITKAVITIKYTKLSAQNNLMQMSTPTEEVSETPTEEEDDMR